jgi:CBS domain-containing protein
LIQVKETVAEAVDNISNRKWSCAMKAADVMVTNVITVGPEASVQDVAETMLSARISAVPVVGKTGELIGIVSEGDLMHRAEAGTGRRRPWWLAAFVGKETLAAEFVREHSRRVTDVMTREVVTAAPDAPLSAIANLLEKKAIKRVPIVKDGKVVGIVSRANLVQAMASAGPKLERVAPADDSTIRNKVITQLDKVITQLDAEPWIRPSLINVIVQDGTVELWGIVGSPSEKKAVRVAAEVTPGVRAVNDNLIIRPAGSGY